jgi:hypothetical protein
MVRALLLLLLLLPAAGLLAATAITVDLGQAQPFQRRGAGWLHSLDASVPAAADLEPLRPRRMRLHPDTAGRAMARAGQLGVVVQVVVSDAWGYHPTGDWPGDFERWDNWERHVRLLARRARRQGWNWEWDLWNEPDTRQFWARDAARHLDTWERGVRALRAELPAAVVVGPSTADHRPETVLAFLRQAQARGVLPDVVSWHELDDRFRFDIETRIEAVRAGMRAMGLSPLPIQINEYLARERSRIPAETLAALVQLERGGADGVKSCWSDLDPGVDEVGSGQITGLLAADGGRRPLWWLYRAYAGLPARTASAGPHQGWWVLAGMDPGRLAVLAGAVAGGDAVLRCIGGGKPPERARIEARRFELRADGTAVAEPARIAVAVEPAADGFRLSIPVLAAGEAVLIEVPLAP